MQKTDFNAFVPPEYFFLLEADCYQWDGKWNSQKELPQFCKLLQNEPDPFAAVSMAWAQAGDEKGGGGGLRFFVDVKQPNPQVAFPDIHKGDSIEFFIDTKNLKQARTTHRFCHHFYFLPERIEGIMARESTRFRTEDSHPHCASDDLEVKIVRKKKSYTAEIFIPEKCLVGFQPEKGSSIGFTYRINRTNEKAQHFVLSSSYCQIDQYPYLWSTVTFT